MKKLFLSAALALTVCASSRAQGLLPSIGLGALPADTAKVCGFTPYTGGFDTSGYKTGAFANDFTLYTPSGTPVHLADELKKGKPVLLVSGSYTCPVFRGKVKVINALAAKYAGKVSVYVVYCLEAHPKTDPSPYSGKEWVTSQNQNENILYRQPTTYGQRKTIAQTMISATGLQATVLLDGPCNPWWSAFGTAPNNAWLIDTDGKVRTHHGWFNRSPLDMGMSIDTLLGNPGPGGGGGPLTGTFTVTPYDPFTQGAEPGKTFEFHSDIENMTDKPAVVRIKRKILQKPASWETGIYLDVALATTADSADVYLDPGTVQPFTFYMYSTQETGTCIAVISIKNLNVPSNVFTVGLTGTTPDPAGVDDQSRPATNHGGIAALQLFPSVQRSGGIVRLAAGSGSAAAGKVRLLSVTGSAGNAQPVSAGGFRVPDLPPGVYLCRFTGNDGIALTGKLIVIP